MDLQYFPMDRQSCSIEIESCKYIVFSVMLCNSSDNSLDWSDRLEHFDDQNEPHSISVLEVY